jgi:thiamine biosynthesis protein ThiI
VGSTRRLLSFLSGGLDSAVATWQMLRRGAKVTCVHFHNRTHEGSAVLEKLEDLCRTLAWAGGEVPLLVVPFEASQRAIVAAVPAPLRMIVYRRAMFRIAKRLAAPEDALGYVTGDSLGQVASQTAENLVSIRAVADLPVYSPLIGSDKVEIVALARRIGTYDISIRPHADCCQFLVPAHPATKSTPEELDRLEATLPWDDLVAAAADGAVRTAHRPDPQTAGLVGAGP